MAKKPGAGWIILVAVVLGLVAVYLIWNLERKREMQSKKNWTQVVVAQQDIPERTKVTREMVTLTGYPKELLPAGALTDTKEVEGRLTVTRVRAKDPIRSSDIASEGQGPTLSFEIPDGMRAIAIQAGEVMAVGTAVKPKDRVDILATYMDPVTRQETTQMILQNVLVLAVNKGETDTQGKAGANSSMTLAVKPAEAELLTAADRAGALRVALRGVQEKTIITSTGVGARDFQGRRTFEMASQPPDSGRATPIIINPPPGGHQRPEIKIYRGAQETTVPAE